MYVLLYCTLRGIKTKGFEAVNDPLSNANSKIKNNVLASEPCM